MFVEHLDTVVTSAVEKPTRRSIILYVVQGLGSIQ